MWKQIISTIDILSILQKKNEGKISACKTKGILGWWQSDQFSQEQLSEYFHTVIKKVTMTDTNTLTPTDAEIVSLAYDCSALPETITDATLLVFAHAVLAKWGAQPVAAPVGMEPTARIRYERNTPGRENEMPRVLSCNRMADGIYEVFTESQVQAMLDVRNSDNKAAPSGTARESLTDEQIQEIWNKASGAIPGWRGHIAYARAIEAAHGITAAQKGGQGAEV